jgi:hypothetical protein
MGPGINPEEFPNGFPGIELEELLISINVIVLLISACISLNVLLKFSVKACVAVWFATMPAGTEIKIAIEKPNAMITNNARIFLLEIFLMALVKTPKYYTFFEPVEK